MEDLFSIFSADQLTDANYCDVLVYPAYNQQHKWRKACIRCFMTCNTMSLVSRLIWERFRWKFTDIFADVCSLHTCFSADSFHILCCITPCESSGRFFGPPGIYIYRTNYRGPVKFDITLFYCMWLLSELGRDDSAVFRGVYGFNPTKMLRRKKVAV